MPFLLVYSPSDFVSTPPAEQASAAAGTPTFTLTLRADAQPTVIEVSDDEAGFDELDVNQTIVNAVDLDGNEIEAGTSVHSAYDLINTSTGHKITSLHFGGSGLQQGAIDGIVSSVRLEPGQTYTFDSERTSYQQDNPYTDYVACLASDTSVRTDKGEVAVQDLSEGDLIETQDNGFQPLRLVLSRKVSGDELADNPKLRPVRITMGAMGNNLPRADLVVSPQHRMMVSSPIVQRMFETSEVLIAAKKLTAVPGVFIDEKMDTVEYYHLVFDDHQIVFAEGAPSESFFPGPIGIASLSDEARREYRSLFGDVRAKDPARPIPDKSRQGALAKRHAKNAKSLL